MLPFDISADIAKSPPPSFPLNNLTIKNLIGTKRQTAETL
jgi:hypothetical protein